MKKLPCDQHQPQANFVGSCNSSPGPKPPPLTSKIHRFTMATRQSPGAKTRPRQMNWRDSDEIVTRSAARLGEQECRGAAGKGDTRTANTFGVLAGKSSEIIGAGTATVPARGHRPRRDHRWRRSISRARRR